MVRATNYFSCPHLAVLPKKRHKMCMLCSQTEKYFVLSICSDGDVDQKLEIHSWKELCSNPKTIELREGKYVLFKNGGSYLKATVITVSDDLTYLAQNWDNFKATFNDSKRFDDKDSKRKNNFSKIVRTTAGIGEMTRGQVLEEHLASCSGWLSVTENSTNNGETMKWEALEESSTNDDTKENDYIRKEYTEKIQTLQNSFKSSDGSPSEKLEIQDFLEYDTNQAEKLDMVVIGGRGTALSREALANINWKSVSAATRALMVACFTREYMAKHTLTGKSSNAFLDNPQKDKKEPLDENIVNDIIEIVMQRTGNSKSMIKSAIRSKCADECKLFKRKNRGKKFTHTKSFTSEH